MSNDTMPDNSGDVKYTTPAFLPERRANIGDLHSLAAKAKNPLDFRKQWDKIPKT
jgi:hypothetical protein